MARTICISPAQRRAHVVTEALAVVTVVPFAGYLATRRTIPTWARVGAGLLAVGGLVVDGGLLLRWASLKD